MTLFPTTRSRCDRIAFYFCAIRHWNPSPWSPGGCTALRLWRNSVEDPWRTFVSRFDCGATSSEMPMYSPPHQRITKRHTGLLVRFEADPVPFDPAPFTSRWIRPSSRQDATPPLSIPLFPFQNGVHFPDVKPSKVLLVFFPGMIAKNPYGRSANGPPITKRVPFSTLNLW